jgi:hypothetical protein
MSETKKEMIEKEIREFSEGIIGKINSFDSIKDKEDSVSSVLNSIIAGVELSKNQKAGVLTYLLHKRVQ